MKTTVKETKAKETKNKAVAFLKEHKNLLTTAGLVVGGAIIGYNAYSLKRKFTYDIQVVNTNIKNVLCDAQLKYGKSNWVFTGAETKALKPEDLGELGNLMLNKYTDVKLPGFTHFIAIGPNNN